MLERNTAPHERSALLDRRSPAKARRATLRQDVWAALRFRASTRPRSGLQLASYLLELCVLALILLNVGFAISESSVVVETPGPALRSTWSSVFLLTSTIVFSVEYALRLWSCVEDERYRSAVVGRLTWMAQPLSILDLVALLPFYLEICFELMLIPSYTGALTLQSLRLLRIISFLRLERWYKAMKNLRAVIGRKREELLVVSFLTMLVVLTSSTTIFFLENSAQPDAFSSIGVCAWWSVETITSLGYGDIVPRTSAGRIFGSALAIWGIVLFTIPGAVLGSGFIEVMLEKQQHDEEDAYARALEHELAPRVSISAGATGDGATGGRSELQIELSPPPAPLSGNAEARRHLSPRVATALALHQLALKLDAVSAAQERFQDQLRAQQVQLAGVTELLELKQQANTRGPPADAC